MFPSTSFPLIWSQLRCAETKDVKNDVTSRGLWYKLPAPYQAVLEERVRCSTIVDGGMIFVGGRPNSTLKLPVS